MVTKLGPFCLKVVRQHTELHKTKVNDERF